VPDGFFPAFSGVNFAAQIAWKMRSAFRRQ